jgi:CDP-6-deoxy-D-xylo-4-hexulose-3-dehydrase
MIPLMKYAFLNEFETKKALAEFIVKTEKLSMDIQCAEFEKQFAKKQGRKEGVLFNSGGSSNLAMLQALKNLGKLKDNDNIGFSSLTWSTNTMPIIQLGMNPIALDCDPDTMNVMSSNILERLKQVPLKAVFVTNVLGFAGDLDEIKNVCKQNNIILIEDNCEALGTALSEDKTGNFGICSSFSFFVAHHMSTIEGGMLCTDDQELAEMFRIVRANGWDRNLNALQQNKWRKTHNINSEFEAKYTFYDLGYNFRPTEITGFIGLYQLQYLDENISIREKNYLEFEQYILQNDELHSINHKHITKLSPFALPITCKNTQLKAKYINQFSGAGIEIRPLIAGNIQNQPFYKKYVKHLFDLPGTDFLSNNSFYCGNYPELSESDKETIISCLIK